MTRTISIRYRRLPDREQIFRQQLLDESGDAIVTFMANADLDRSVEVAGRPILQPGSPVIWFTYPGRWHDLGVFHLPDGTFTGYYANILTPVVMTGDEWTTTDLCLDVWLGVDGRVELLDKDDFDRAVAAGWLDASDIAAARSEAEALLAGARAGSWPPEQVKQWDLARAMAQFTESSP